MSPSPSAVLDDFHHPDLCNGAVSSFRKCGLPCGLCRSLCTLQRCCLVADTVFCVPVSRLVGVAGIPSPTPRFSLLDGIPQTCLNYLLHHCNTQYEWLVKPYSSGTFTPKETPSLLGAPLLQSIAPLFEKTTLRQFSQVIIGMLVASGRITMLGLSRWTEKGGSYRTIQRIYHSRLPWQTIQWLFFLQAFLAIRR